MNWVLHLFDLSTISSILTQFQHDVHEPGFWLAVGEIIWINVLLSGDNALVIALACRGLAPRQLIGERRRKKNKLFQGAHNK